MWSIALHAVIPHQPQGAPKCTERIELLPFDVARARLFITFCNVSPRGSVPSYRHSSILRSRMANRKFCDVLALGYWLAVLSRVDAIALVPFSKSDRSF